MMLRDRRDRKSRWTDTVEGKKALFLLRLLTKWVLVISDTLYILKVCFFLGHFTLPSCPTCPTCPGGKT